MVQVLTENEWRFKIICHLTLDMDNVTTKRKRYHNNIIDKTSYILNRM